MAEDPDRKKKKGVLRSLSSVLLTSAFLLIALLSVAIFLLSRGLPDVAIRWIEQKISSGRLCYSFERVSFDLADGVRLGGARVYVKRRLGKPMLAADELDIKLRVRRNSPVYAWIDSIRAKNLVCNPFNSLDDMDRFESDFSGGTSVADFFDFCSISNSWLTTAIPVRLEGANIFNVKCRNALGDLFIRDGALILENIRLNLLSDKFEEAVVGWLTYDPRKAFLQTRITGSLIPDSIRELCLFLEFTEAVKYFDDMDAYTSPLQATGEISWNLEPQKGDAFSQDMRLAVSGSDFTFREMPLKDFKLSAQWLAPPESCSAGILSIAPVSCKTAEGIANLSARIVPKSDFADLNVEAAMPIKPLCIFADSDYPEIMTNVVFSAPPEVRLSGRIFTKEEKVSGVLNGTVTARDAELFKIPVEKFNAKISFIDDESVELREIDATVFGGQVTGEFKIEHKGGTDVSPDGELHLKLDLDRVDCARARKHFGEKTDAIGGRASGMVDVRALAVENRFDTLHGHGEIHVRDGNLLRIPLFAGLTDFIGKYVPGMDLLLMQSDADLSMYATNGIVNLKELKVEGNIFSLVANGKCRIDSPAFPVEGVAQLRFFKQATLVGKLMKLVTLPVSKMMEFRVTGPINNISWNYIGLLDRLKNLTFWPDEDATAMPEKDAAAIIDAPPVGNARKEDSGK